jgi:malate synthase
VVVTDKQLADPKIPGKITEQGVRDNVSAWVSPSPFCAHISFPSLFTGRRVGVKSPIEKILTTRALSYCAAWISGNGCVPINHLMVCLLLFFPHSFLPFTPFASPR